MPTRALEHCRPLAVEISMSFFRQCFLVYVSYVAANWEAGRWRQRRPATTYVHCATKLKPHNDDDTMILTKTGQREILFLYGD